MLSTTRAPIQALVEILLTASASVAMSRLMDMSLPRPVVAGRTYLITRRCVGRQFLLRPDPRVNQAFLYCLGVAAERFNITLHGWVALGNHEHLILRDNEGNFPDFLAFFHGMLARCLNAYWGRWDYFWDSSPPNAVYLVEPQDRFDKLIYTLANPALSHLVDRACLWPGASSLLQNLSGRPLVVARPWRFFREEGPMPETVTLHAEKLDGFEHLSQEEYATRIADAVAAAEAAARAKRHESGTRVVGRKAVLRAEPTDRPSTVEPRRKLRPLVACRNKARRIAELLALKAFRFAHEAARLAFLAGARDTAFPFGTFAWKARGANCASCPHPPW